MPEDYSEDQKELYKKAGEALEQAQVLEMDAGNVVLVFLALPFKERKPTKEETEALKKIIEDLSGRTLGRILREVKGLVILEEGVEEAISAGLQSRNYVIHKIFLKHNFGIFSPTGREKIIEDLDHHKAVMAKAARILKGIGSGLDQLFELNKSSVELAEKLILEGKSKNLI